MPTDLLSTREACERLGVPVSTFHGWVDAGRIEPVLKAHGLRGPMFFRPDDVDQLAEDLDEAS